MAGELFNVALIRPVSSNLSKLHQMSACTIHDSEKSAVSFMQHATRGQAAWVPKARE